MEEGANKGNVARVHRFLNVVTLLVRNFLHLILGNPERLGFNPEILGNPQRHGESDV